eukprot:686959-Hanusia_phi.AAC.1
MQEEESQVNIKVRQGRRSSLLGWWGRGREEGVRLLRRGVGTEEDIFSWWRKLLEDPLGGWGWYIERR